MKVEFYPDPGGPWLVIRFAKDPRASATEEEIELIVSEDGDIYALRVWLGEVKLRFPDESVERIAVNYLANGWSLSETDGRPWIFYQFAPAKGKISIIDWVAEVFAVDEEKRITKIEIWLRGIQKELQLP